MAYHEHYKWQKKYGYTDRLLAYRDAEPHEVKQLKYLDENLHKSLTIHANAKWDGLKLGHFGKSEIDVVIQYRHHVWICDLKFYTQKVQIKPGSKWKVGTETRHCYLDTVEDHAKKFAAGLKKYSGFKNHKKVIGYVAFQNLKNVLITDPLNNMQKRIVSQEAFVKVINKVVSKAYDSSINPQQSEFGEFAAKHAGASDEIRVSCPVHPQHLLSEEKGVFDSKNVVSGMLLNTDNNNEAEFYFVRIDENFRDENHDKGLLNLSKRLKKYGELGVKSVEVPRIHHDIDNFCVWFLYPLERLNPKSGKAQPRRPLVSFLSETPFDLALRIGFCVKVLQSIKSLHNLNFAHRLLSAESVWVEPSGEDIVLFGFERVKNSKLAFGDVTVTGLTASLRNSFWDPPEYKTTDRFSKANHFQSDIYSAGLLLAFILNENPVQLFEQVVSSTDSEAKQIFLEGVSEKVAEIPGLITQLELALGSDSKIRPSVESLLKFFLSCLDNKEGKPCISFSDVSEGVIIDNRFEIKKDLVPGEGSGFKVYLAFDNQLDRDVVLKYANDDLKVEELVKEKENIANIRRLSEISGELAGIKLPQLLSPVDISPDLGASFFVREFFEVDSSEVIYSDPVKLFSNLKKLLKFVSLAHQDDFAIRDICHTNVQWCSGDLTILDLGSVCRLGDPDRTFNGKVDFLPPLRSDDLEAPEQRVLRDYYAALVTCFRWAFGIRPWDFHRVNDVASIQLNTIPEEISSRFTDNEFDLIKGFFEKTLGRAAFKNGQYATHESLHTELDELLDSLNDLVSVVPDGPIEEFQGYIFDSPVEPRELALAKGESISDDRIGYLLSCSLDYAHEDFDSIVRKCHEIDRDHRAFEISEDSRGEFRLALLKRNSLQFSERDFLNPFEASSSLFSDVALSAISLLDKVSGTDLSCYWSGDRFWVLPNKVLEMIGLPRSSSPLYLQLHDILTNFDEYALSADDYPDAFFYRETLVELRDALLNPSAFPTEKFGQLVLPDGHFFPSSFEVVFGSDDVSGKQVILLSCGWDSGGELYSSMLAQLKAVKYRYRLFTVSENNDSDYGMGLLESTISLSSYPEDLQAAIDSDEFTNVTIENCISFLEDIGDLAHSDSYILMFVESDFRIVPSALLSKIGIHTPVSVLGDQCLDMLRKVSSLPEEISDWNFDTLSQVKDHVRFLNDLQDRGDEWRVVLEELPWEEVQGYLTHCMEKQAGPFRTHDMYAYPDEAKLGAGGSGTVYRTLPDGLVLKIANTSKSVEGNPGGIEEEKWTREVALHERVRGYSLPGLTQFINEERGFMYFRCDPGETLKSRFESGVTFSDFVSLVFSFKDYLSSLHTLAIHDIFATDICPDNIIVVDVGSSRGARCIHIDLGPGYHPFWSPPEEDFSGGVITKPLNGMMYSFSKVLAGEILLMGSANRSVLDDWYQFAITYYSESESGSLDTHDLVYSNGLRADRVEVWRNLEDELTRSIVEVCNVGQSRLNEVLPRILKFFRSGLNPDLNDRFINLQQMNEELQSFRSFLLESR